MNVKLVRGRTDEGGPCYEVRLLDDDGALLIVVKHQVLEAARVAARKWKAAVEDGTAESMIRPISHLLRFP